MTNHPPTITCPAWCQSDDHDAGEAIHHVDWTVGLSALPYEVQGERYLDHVNIVLEQEPGKEPYLLIEMPAEVRGQDDPRITLDEAAGIAATITALVTAGRTGGEIR